MKVALRHRHFGFHSLINQCSVRGRLSEFARKKPRCNPKYRNWSAATDYKVKEKDLIAALPRRFLPVSPSEILLVVNDTGQTDLDFFRNWSKYFDSYSLHLTNE